MERGNTVTEFSIEVHAEDMFGVMQEYDMTIQACSYEDIEHQVWESYGVTEYRIVAHETFELPIYQ